MVSDLKLNMATNVRTLKTELKLDIKTSAEALRAESATLNAELKSDNDALKLNLNRIILLVLTHLKRRCLIMLRNLN